jgi:hypothetical protein
MEWTTEELEFYVGQGFQNYFFSVASRPMPKPTEPPVQWTLRTLFLGGTYHFNPPS